MKKLLMLKLLLTFLLFPNLGYTKIIEADLIESHFITPILEKIDKDTLVIINIDNTIIIPKSKMLASSVSPHRSFINILINSTKKKPFYNAAVAEWYLKRKMQLVETEWPELINKLKAQNATVIGISQFNDVVYKVISSPEERQYNELAALGIKFTEKVLDHDNFEITKMGNRSAMFYKGIIFTGPFSKVNTIDNFLKVSSLIPNKIIVFDSSYADIEQIERKLRTFDLDNYNIHYLGLNNFKQVLPDDKIVDLQQKTLLNEAKWLEDEEAEALLKSSTTSNTEPLP